MIRLILRNTQNALLFATVLLVILAFQRLQSYDLQYNSLGEDPAYHQSDQYHLKVGLFRFVIPKWHRYDDTMLMQEDYYRVFPRLQPPQLSSPVQLLDPINNSNKLPDSSSLGPSSKGTSSKPTVLVSMPSCDVLGAMKVLQRSLQDYQHRILISKKTNQRCGHQIAHKHIVSKNGTTSSALETCQIVQSLRDENLQTSVVFVPHDVLLVNASLLPNTPPPNASHSLVVKKHLTEQPLCGQDTQRECGYYIQDCPSVRVDHTRFVSFGEWNCPLPWECPVVQPISPVCQLLQSQWQSQRNHGKKRRPCPDQTTLK